MHSKYWFQWHRKRQAKVIKTKSSDGVRKYIGSEMLLKRMVEASSVATSISTLIKILEGILLPSVRQKSNEVEIITQFCQSTGTGLFLPTASFSIFLELFVQITMVLLLTKIIRCHLANPLRQKFISKST